MFTVYAIKSISHNFIYVGMTENLEERYQDTIMVTFNPPKTSALSTSSIKNKQLMEFKQELEKSIISQPPVKGF